VYSRPRIWLDPGNAGGGASDPPADETGVPDVAALQAEIATLKAANEALKKGGGDAEVRRLKAELRTAKTALDAMTAERDTLKTTVATLEGQVSETTTKAALKDAGIDPEDTDYVMAKFAKVEADADGNKPDLAEFLADAKATKAGWYVKIATPATTTPAPATPAPKAPAATPAAPAAATPAAPVAATPAAPVTPPPASPDAPAARTVVKTQASGTGPSAADIRAMTPEQYKAHRASIRASLGQSPTPS
jgi:hypothetical protein